MKLLLSYRSFLVILFVFAGNIAAAQDEATSRFIDSLKTPPPLHHDSLLLKYDSATTGEAVTDSSAEEDLPPMDTAIVSHFRQISADSIAAIKKDKGFYYQTWLDSILRAEEAKMKAPRTPPTINLPNLGIFLQIFQIVLWILAGALLVFILYKLFLGQNSLFLKNRKNLDAVIDVEEEEITAGRYDPLIKKAEAEGNYRLAVRYLHLQALYNLAQKLLVQIGTGKTNYQYLDELRKGPAAIAKHFSDLTYKYEYIWYGEYPINNNMYTSLRNEFTEFNKKIEAV